MLSHLILSSSVMLSPALLCQCLSVFTTHYITSSSLISQLFLTLCLAPWYLRPSHKIVVSPSLRSKKKTFALSQIKILSDRSADHLYAPSTLSLSWGPFDAKADWRATLPQVSFALIYPCFLLDSWSCSEQINWLHTTYHDVRFFSLGIFQGKFEDISQESNKIFHLDTYEGIMINFQRGLSNSFMIDHAMHLQPSAEQYGTYHFGANFAEGKVSQSGVEQHDSRDCYLSTCCWVRQLRMVKFLHDTLELWLQTFP